MVPVAVEARGLWCPSPGFQSQLCDLFLWTSVSFSLNWGGKCNVCKRHGILQTVWKWRSVCVLRRQRASQGPQCREPLCKPRRVGPDVGLEFKRLLSFELGHLAPDSSSSSSRLATWPCSHQLPTLSLSAPVKCAQLPLLTPVWLQVLVD